MQHLLPLLQVAAISAGVASILSLLVGLLLPLATGFISAELSKFWLWVQNLGVVWGSIVGALIAGLGAALTAVVQAHIPGLAHWIPADLHAWTAEAVVGFLVGLVNFLLGVPVALRAARLKRGTAYKF